MRSDDGLSVAVAVGPTGHSGIGRYNRELVRSLAERDDLRVTLIGTVDEVAEIHALLGKSMPSIVTGRHRLLGQIRMLFAARRLARSDVDVVHGTRHVLPLRWRGAAVLTFHDDYALTRAAEYDVVKRLTLPPVFRRALRRADVVVTLSPEMCEVARRRVDPSRIVVDGGAAASSELTSAVPSRPRSMEGIGRFALVVGDAGPRKRVDELMDAWRSVDDVMLVVAGGRAAPDGLRGRLHTDPNVQLIDGPTDGELAWLYGHTDLVVDASNAEGFGFARVEAAAFGARLLTLRDSETEGSPAPDADTWGRTVRSALSDSPAALRSDVNVEPPIDWPTVADRTVEAYRAAVLVRSTRSARLRR